MPGVRATRAARAANPPGVRAHDADGTRAYTRDHLVARADARTPGGCAQGGEAHRLYASAGDCRTDWLAGVGRRALDASGVISWNSARAVSRHAVRVPRPRRRVVPAPRPASGLSRPRARLTK